ncbi:MAG: dihydrodipicolinate synthase family protein [Epulopiscium sp.]|nr:dihydrodipicolinate synthase family protein [Candidatus Epulonipiscium sp.]
MSKYQEIKERLNQGLFPAVPIPFTKEGKIHMEAQRSYMEYMKKQPVDGLSLWVHTGRGLYITEEQRKEIFTLWREAMPDKVMIVGVGADLAACEEAEDVEAEYIKQSVAMAKTAKALGADACLVYAPKIYKGREDMEEKILAYHKEIAKVGLPIILFYLYEAAGGILYSLPLLEQLFQIEEVVGIKMASLDSVMTYQDISTFIQEKCPDKLLITGEDRMFGYTMMRGAQGALIGLSCACGDLQKAMMKAWYEKDIETFVKLALQVDELAECTFVAPMEGYIKRMLMVLHYLGVIPREATYDPWGPIEELSVEEAEKIKSVLKKIGQI